MKVLNILMMVASLLFGSDLRDPKDILTEVNNTNNKEFKLSCNSMYAWTDPEWVLWWKLDYTYDSSGRLVNILDSKLISDVWYNRDNYIYSYNENGLLSEYIYQYMGTEEWQNQVRYTYEYNSDNVLTYIYDYEWIENEWNLYRRSVYSYFGDNDFEAVSQEYTGTEWVTTGKTVSELDPDGKILSQTSQAWSGEWINFFRSEHTYNGNLEEEYIDFEWSGSEWVYSYKIDNFFDDSLLNTRIERLTWNGTWNYLNRDFNYFDENNNLTEYISENYQEGSWVNACRGTNTYFDIAGITGNTLPDKIELFQNYPNPFNPETEISFTLNKTAEVKLAVYNLNGQLIKELAKAKFNSGNHKFSFNASELNSGIYFYMLDTGENSITKKMMLLK